MQDKRGWEARAVGATLVEGGVRFRVWAPEREKIELVLFDDGKERALPLERLEDGYHEATVEGAGPGSRYKFRVDGDGPFPDPASRYQPEGVHGPSEVVDPSFDWSDGAWQGITMEELIIYELHVGSATAEGTFEALIGRLDDLVELGVTAIELMPVADFPGTRNWGYDGVSLWAPSRNYGRPEGLKRLVNEAHRRGLAVLLDVVYNHLGPDGNYLGVYSNRYYDESAHTPWGAALNYGGPDSRPVRDFFIGNALYWLRDFHIDGLRLDATHEIIDESDEHLLAELARRARAEIAHPVLLTAEDERNLARLALPQEEGGAGLDGLWADDFNHQVRVALTGEDEGYFGNYSGESEDLARTIERGWFYEGQIYTTTGQQRGTSAEVLPLSTFIHCIQNHDQIGNRALGERLHHQISSAAYRAASALLLLDPGTPLLFMGQEWAASSPFLFFTDHHDELGRMVTEGRRREFAYFSAFQNEETRELIPDPQARSTFLRSRLHWEEREEPEHAAILSLYQSLLHLRKSHPALLDRTRESVAVRAVGSHAVALRRQGAQGAVLLLVVNLAGAVKLDLDDVALARGGQRTLRLSTEEPRFGGEGGVDLAGTTLRFAGPGAALIEIEP